ncbi:MAG: 50S ribosomal protein L21 [Cyanobium sp. M30B3]|jgi:large subunit ribosomal protein L21|nr:MAG: 50S ribosomal protein L21 [Cyanobium sp. M30B3]
MTQTPSTTSTSPADAGSKAAGNADQPGPYAIVESSGQQFWLQPNRYYDIDRLAADVDSIVNLENVLLVNDGKAATLGQPYVAGATVELKVMAHRRGPKLIVYKMRPKKKTRRKNGHRQELTRVMVQSIKVAGKALN